VGLTKSAAQTFSFASPPLCVPAALRELLSPVPIPHTRSKSCPSFNPLNPVQTIASPPLCVILLNSLRPLGEGLWLRD